MGAAIVSCHSAGAAAVAPNEFFAECRGLDVFRYQRPAEDFRPGDSDALSGVTQDLGTAFVLATSVNGSSRVHVSGNVGYASSGLPSAGFRTTYRRDDGNGAGPQLALTVRQNYLPSLMGSGAPGSDTPVLRTATISSFDKMDLADLIHLEYGFSLESVSLFGRINSANPFARATYDVGQDSAVQLAVSSGTQPVELLAAGSQTGFEQGPEQRSGGFGTSDANLAPRQPRGG